MEGFDLSTASGIYLGGSEISALYLGSSLIWPTNFQEEYLTITSIGRTLNYNSYNIIKFYATDISCVRQIQVSYDKVNWTTYTSSMSGTQIGSLKRGRKLYVRGYNSCYSEGEDYYNYFSSSNEIFVSGNIMSLIDYENFREMTILSEPYALAFLFKHSTVTDASNLILPATTLSAFCYMGLFEDTLLTKSPKELPAITIAEGCYCNMFKDCSYMKTAPSVLPANILANLCYSGMFYDCMSLRTAPELPATILADYCYECMFWNCYELEHAPILPAVTLCVGSYRAMFGVCRSLVNPPQLPATTLAANCYDSMFDSCTSLKPNSGYELPATTLATECYYNMFENCTAMTESPILPATTLATRCYKWMFHGCSLLSKITMLTTDEQIYSKDAINNWVYGVAPTGTFIKSKGYNTIRQNDDSGIPRGWIIENKYSISIVNTSGGTISVSRPYANEGQRVYILEHPDTGYAFDYMTVVDTQGNPIQVNYNTFIMPQDSVIITSYWISYSDMYLTIESLSNNNQISWNCTNPQSTNKQIQYSKDKITWYTENSSGGDTPFVTLQYGERLYIKATNYTYGDDFVYHFGTTGEFKVYGNIMSMLYGDNFENETTLTNTRQLQGLFRNCIYLTDASNLILPATTLSEYCYNNMFYGCASMTVGPTILPAITLADYCYSYMFCGCSLLEKSPDLPAKNITTGAYEYMFINCTTLHEIKMLATNRVTGSTYLWVDNVAPTGTFYKAESMSDLPIGPSGIPTGWLVINTPPQYSISITPTQNGTVVSNVQRADYGDTVTLTITPATDYELNVLTVLDKDGNYVTVTNNQFTMPNSNVIIYATFADYSELYFAIESLENNNEIRWYGTPNVGNAIQYSYNKVDWSSAIEPSTSSPSTLIVTLNNHDIVYFKGNIHKTTNNRPSFAINKNAKVYGNIMSLCEGDNFIGVTTLTNDYMFADLFQYNMIIDASKLILPATTLTNYCYLRMFYYCEYMTAAPQLPATTLSEGCYNSMFYGCWALLNAPQLPATTLATRCYMRMFLECKSLVSAPSVLPATTLAERCYEEMFCLCRVLTSAPQLPATTLAERSYYGMFSGSILVNSITMLAKDISATDCLTNWVNGVADTGTFVKAGAMQTLSTGASGIPTGWTVVDNGQYAIIISTIQNGSVTSNMQRADRLDVVTLTITPDTGYTFDTLTIVDQWNNPIQTIVGSPNQFIMPSSNVTVSATFTANSYNVTISQITNGTVTSDKNTATYGETVTLTVTPATGYILDTLTVVDSSSNPITVTNNQFNMPASNVTISATFIQSYDVQYLTIESNAAGNTIYWKCSNASYTQDIQYSTDLTNWTTVTSTTSGTALATLGYRNKLYLKGSLVGHNSGSYYDYFTSTGTFKIYGNIMSLTHGDNFTSATTLSQYYQLTRLFASSKVTDALNLILPATTLSRYCYQNMFNGCTQLTIAPRILPATSVEYYSYASMFQGCTSLVTPPVLCGITLGGYAYSTMFAGCTSLTSLPRLADATTITSWAPYRYMFGGCTGITDARYDVNGDRLLPTHLTVSSGGSAFELMFQNCTNLQYAPELTDMTPHHGEYNQMFKGCTSLYSIITHASSLGTANFGAIVENTGHVGTVYKAKDVTWDTSQYSQFNYTSGSAWTVIDGNYNAGDYQT